MSDYINENLLDASPMKKQKEEAKALVGKWEKTGLLDGIDGDYNRSGMSILLENQARELIDESTIKNVFEKNKMGGELEKIINVAF